MGKRAVLGLAISVLACTKDAGRGDEIGAPCSPGTTAPCSCASGATGIATCGPDGSLGMCVCSDGTGTTAAASTMDGGSSTCGDGCTGTGADSTTSCADGPRYAGLVDAQSSSWSDNGMTGLAAGQAKCAAIGADHVCEYEEVKQAVENGELDDLPVGTTAWIHRTTIESVDGVPSAPGPGGRCIDWTYDMDSLADGEYLEVDADGPAFVLDPDTFYDGLDTSHADPADLPCGGVLRAILCCRPACG